MARVKATDEQVQRIIKELKAQLEKTWGEINELRTRNNQLAKQVELAEKRERVLFFLAGVR